MVIEFLLLAGGERRPTGAGGEEGLDAWPQVTGSHRLGRELYPARLTHELLVAGELHRHPLQSTAGQLLGQG